MLKIFSVLWILTTVPAVAASFYQAFDFNDSHHIKAIMPTGIAVDEAHIDKRLHVRFMEVNGSVRTLFWLEDNASKRIRDVEIDSIYAPFLVENNDSDGFSIENIKSLSKDQEILERLTGIVDALQYIGHKEGIFTFANALGRIEVNQSIEKTDYKITYKKQLNRGKIRDDITFIDTVVLITPDSNTTWHAVHMNALLKVQVPALKTIMFDRRRMQLTPSDATLPSTHWFMHLGPDIRTWPFGKTTTTTGMSYKEASKLFKQKEREFLAIGDDIEKRATWVLENMDFLSHLSTLLENHTLDDKASRILFATLGYVDTPKSSSILAQVLLNKKINDKERFRSIMGLKNTTAPIEDETLDTLISYGLSVGNDSMLQRGTGMFLGALAHQRSQRVPSQAKKISNAIVEAIRTSDDKVVSLNAAANMKSSASEEVVRSVEETLMDDPNPLYRRKSAEALEQIKKSNLTASDFETLYNNEKDSATKAAIIRSSVAAKDFKNNEAYHSFLLDVAATPSESASNRTAALEALEKNGFGRTEEEKKILRKMMVGVKNEQLTQKLLKLYRRQ